MISARTGTLGESGAEDGGGPHAVLEGFLEEVPFKLRPGGGERLTWQDERRMGSQWRYGLFGNLRTDPCGWRDQHEGTGRW